MIFSAKSMNEFSVKLYFFTGLRPLTDIFGTITGFANCFVKYTMRVLILNMLAFDNVIGFLIFYKETMRRGDYLFCT
jgi:hypothetical protein